MITPLLPLVILLVSPPHHCVPFTDAQSKIGEKTCVTGKVLNISSSERSGTQFLNFCSDYKKCPFTVVVFARDLRDVGDLRRLEGKTVEIHGKIKQYHGQAEMILSDSDQLNGADKDMDKSAANPPALPENYDVENHGKFSAGQFRSFKPNNKRKKKQFDPNANLDPSVNDTAK